MKVEQEEGWEKIRYRFIFLQGMDGYEEMTRNGERISFITVWMETTCQLVQHISTLSQLFNRYIFFIPWQCMVIQLFKFTGYSSTFFKLFTYLSLVSKFAYDARK